MSGIFSRVKATFQARANEAVDLMEDPRLSLDYSLARLEENRRALNRSLVEVCTARQRLETQRDQLAASVQKYEQQAQASILAEREDMARTVLERKQEAQERLVELESNLAAIEGQVETLKTSQASLERKIIRFRNKKEELKSLYDSSRAQLQVREAVSGISADLADAGNTIRRIEERIQAMRSRSEAINKLVAEGVLVDVLEMGTDDTDRQLAQLRRSQAVEDELAQMKAMSPAE